MAGDGRSGVVGERDVLPAEQAVLSEPAAIVSGVELAGGDDPPAHGDPIFVGVLVLVVKRRAVDPHRHRLARAQDALRRADAHPAVDRALPKQADWVSAQVGHAAADDVIFSEWRVEHQLLTRFRLDLSWRHCHLCRVERC